MRIEFERVSMHHFMSFGDAEVDLRDRGYCLIEGSNRDPRDSAKSNGSGKSTIFNAISYALTGETLQGLRSNLPNKEFNDGCRVRLDFSADGHRYSVERSKDDPAMGTSLRIAVDGRDASGKGIRESQAALSAMLPDLTPELIGSVVMLGQGMPMRFTSNTPSGRKEVLEHLSHSDFMIEDLKSRIAARASELDAQSREAEDAALVGSTRLSMAEDRLASAEAALSSMGTADSLRSDVAALEGEASALGDAAKGAAEEASEAKDALAAANASLSEAKAARSDRLMSVAAQHAEAKAGFAKDIASAKATASMLRSELSRMESIRDVCPTCGQRIPGVVRPDTSAQRDMLRKAEDRLAAAEADEAEDEKAYREAVDGIEKAYGSKASQMAESVDALKRRSADLDRRSADAYSAYADASRRLERAKAELDGFTAKAAKAKEDAERLAAERDALKAQCAEAEAKKSALAGRKSIVSRLATMAKRDFRGILLEGVIQYIGERAKAFSSAIFGTDGVGFGLDGNDISITYDGKDYENLSGGERQRVDLIVQFALRDMMSEYSGFSANILVLDEIADGLDSVSCEKVLNFITSGALGDVGSVFIISHHADELDIPCDSVVEVVKDSSGVSSII